MKKPDNWTDEQFASAQRVCERHNIPFVPSEWVICFGDFIGRDNTSGMFIGIEKDGYAHT
jgi:hypothetical protein